MANPFFDAAYYLAQNPDVEAAFGDDAAAAEAHYIANGADEGRKPAQWFDAAYYQSSNADLAGLAPNQLFEHFANHGVDELRSPSAGLEIDAATFQAYADANEDLRNAFDIEEGAELTNEQVAALARHFFEYGIHEEDRPGKPELPEEPADLSELTEALDALKVAEEAKADFLEEAEESDVIAAAVEGGAYKPEDDDLEEFIEDGLIDWAKEQLNTEGVAGDPDDDERPNLGYDFTGVSDSALPAMIEDVKAELAEALAKATAEVNKAKGLKNAVDVRSRAEDRLEAAVEAEGEAATDAEAELAKVNKLNDPDPVWTLKKIFSEPGEGEDTGRKFTEDFLDDRTIIDGLIVVGENNKLEAHEGVENDLPDGFAELLAATQTWFDSVRTLLQRDGALVSAEERVAGFIEDAVKDGIWDDEAGAQAAIDAYEQAGTDVEEFDEAVEQYEEAQALVDALAGHNEAVEEATETLDGLGYVLQNFDEDNVGVGTEDNDAFIYIAEEDYTIEFFGEVGDDVLFIGTEFSFGGNDTSAGDNAVLEVFFTQDGDDTIVTVEHVPFGSNSAGDEVDVIVLTGVNAEDLVFTDGYVVFA